MSLIQFGHGAMASQIAGPGHWLQRTREDLLECQPTQKLRKTDDITLATLGERRVRNPGMLA